MIIKKLTIIFYLLLIFGCSTAVKKDGVGQKNNAEANDFFLKRVNLSDDAFFDEKYSFGAVEDESLSIVESNYNSCLKGDEASVRKMLDFGHHKAKKELGTIYFLIGNCKFMNGQFLPAKYYYNLSLGKLEKNNSEVRAMLYGNMALMYYLNGFFAQGEVFLAKAEQEGIHLSYITYNKGIRHLVVGNYFMSKKIFSKLYLENKNSKILKKLLMYTSFLLGEFDENSVGVDAGDEDISFFKKYKNYYFGKEISKEELSEFKELSNLTNVIKNEMAKTK